MNYVIHYKTSEKLQCQGANDPNYPEGVGNIDDVTAGQAGGREGRDDDTSVLPGCLVLGRDPLLQNDGMVELAKLSLSPCQEFQTLKKGLGASVSMPQALYGFPVPA